WMQNNRDKVEEFIKDSGEAGDGFSLEEFEQAINEIGNSGWIFTITLFVAVLVGVVGLILLRGNKKPRQAGILLTGSSVLLTIIVGIGAGIGGLFYLIAGLLCFFRNEDPTSI